MSQSLPACLMASLLALSVSVVAQSPPVGMQDSRLLTEEVMHSFTVYPYQPPFVLDARPAGSVRDDVPEAVVAAWVGAMRAGQFDQATRFWDSAAQRQIAERDKATNKQPAASVQQWKQLFGNSKSNLVQVAPSSPSTTRWPRCRNASMPIRSSSRTLSAPRSSRSHQANGMNASRFWLSDIGSAAIQQVPGKGSNW
jgi:hypothetical protein